MVKTAADFIITAAILTAVFAILGFFGICKFKQSVVTALSVLMFSAVICAGISLYTPEEGTVYISDLSVRKPDAGSSGAAAKSKISGIVDLPNESCGVVNINSASLSELTSLHGIGSAKASSIIEMREDIGAFKSVDDLVCVSGIIKNTLDGMRDFTDIK